MLTSSPTSGQTCWVLGRIRPVIGAGASVWRWWRVPKAARRFDSDHYLAARGNYADWLKQPGPWAGVPPVTLEEKVAFIDAVTASLRAEAPSLASPDGKLGGVNERNVAKAFDGVDFRKGLTAREMETLWGKLFLAANTDPETYPSLIRQGVGGSLSGLAKQRFEAEFARRGLVPALQAMGYLRQPGVAGRFRDFLTHNQNDLRFNFNGLLNVAVISAGAPPILPRWDFFAHSSFPEALYQKGLREGVDAIKDDFLRWYRPRANAQIAWNRFADGLNVIATSAFLYFTYEDQKRKAKEEAAKRGAEVKEKVTTVTESVRPAKMIGNDLFEGWKQKYREANGVDPDPESDEYKLYEKIFSMPPPSTASEDSSSRQGSQDD